MPKIENTITFRLNRRSLYCMHILEKNRGGHILDIYIGCISTYC